MSQILYTPQNKNIGNDNLKFFADFAEQIQGKTKMKINEVNIEKLSNFLDNKTYKKAYGIKGAMSNIAYVVGILSGMKNVNTSKGVWTKELKESFGEFMNEMSDLYAQAQKDNPNITMPEISERINKALNGLDTDKMYIEFIEKAKNTTENIFENYKKTEKKLLNRVHQKIEDGNTKLILALGVEGRYKLTEMIILGASIGLSIALSSSIHNIAMATNTHNHHMHEMAGHMAEGPKMPSGSSAELADNILQFAASTFRTILEKVVQKGELVHHTDTLVKLGKRLASQGALRFADRITP